MTPLRVINRCGECTECCVAFPFLPEKGWWDDGKKAGAPCRFLKTGCTIHDQPRPTLCTSYRCEWLNGGFGSYAEEWRPDRCGIIVSAQDTATLFLTDDGLRQCGYRGAEMGIHIQECRPRALISLDRHRLYYRLCKTIKARFHRELEFVMVNPCGCDVLFSDSARFRIQDYRIAQGFGVAWTTDEQRRYAEELHQWWCGQRTLLAVG